MKGKNFLVAVGVMAMVSLVAGVALADEASEARWNLTKKTPWFAAGYLFGHLVHEAGHEVAARLEGVDMEWDLGGDNKWLAKNYSNAELRNIAFGGFGADMLITEVILGVDKIPKDNAYILGVLAYGLADFFLYPLRSELQGGYGDLATLRQTGVDTGLVEVGLITYGILTVYRLYKKPAFMPFIRATRDEFVLGIGWRF